MADVETERIGHIAVVRLNRPDSLNALSVAMDQELAAIWSQINSDPSVRVAVLSAVGDRAFCVGADINDLENRERTRIAVGGGITGLGGPRLRLRKPLIAAVHGHTLGSGFELAMCADLIVAASNTKFGIPEPRLGILDGAGVIHRVSRALPYRIAMSMILAGEILEADTARHFGLVNEVVSRAELEPAALLWADRVVEASPLVAQAAKEAVNDRLGEPLDVALATRYESIEALAFTRDRTEGLAAFRERRKPDWEGR